MARELDIVVTAETTQAEQALGRVEEGMRRVETVSPMTARAIEEAGARADKSIEALEKKWEAQERASEKARKSSVAAMGELEAAVRRYAAPAAIGFAIKQTLVYADSVDTLSQKLGIAPGRLQALEFSAKQFNIQLEPLARAITTMSDRIASGDKSLMKALDELELSFQTIRSMSPDGAFLEIARAIAKVEDPMKRAALAQDAFGRGGHELLPLLTSDVDKLMQKAKDLGFVMEDDVTKAAADLNDEIGNLLDVGKRLIVAFFAPLLPLLNPLVSWFTFLTAELGKMINTILSPLDQMREFAELLGLIQTRMPNAPKGPGMTFDPGMLATPGDPATAGVFGQTLDYWENRLKLPRGRRTREVPFERPLLQGEWDWNTSALFQAQHFGLSRPLSFPGWAPLPSSYGEFGLPMVPYAGSVSMNRPNLRTPWLQGAGGRFLGAGLGSLAGFIPGMSGQGSMIGSSFGGALGSISGIAKSLGSFVPFLGPIAGIAGGLIGKLFGPSEGTKTNRARGSFVSDFGGMEALQSAADRAGFNLDKLLSTKKTDVLASEIKKLEQAVAKFDEELANANAELEDMQGLLDQTIQKGKELGYEFNQQGELVSVDFKKMQEAAERYGIDVESLGDKFHADRIHADAAQVINDFELLVKGGADLGAVLFGSREELSKMVLESIKFGTDLPAQMQPWIHELVKSGQLLSEDRIKANEFAQELLNMGEDVSPTLQNILSSFIQTGDLLDTTTDKTYEFSDLMMLLGGSPTEEAQKLVEKFAELGLKLGDSRGELTDLSGLRFGDPMVTEFEKLTKSLDEVVKQISDLVTKIAEMTAPKTIHIGWQVDPPPDIPNPDTMSMGGFVDPPKYLAGGGFLPRGTDTVPAMLTPGEGVMRRGAVERLMRGDWPQSGSNITVNVTVEGGDRGTGDTIAEELIDGLKRRGVRLNAA